ncbi:MAG: helicase-related protein [Cyanobacteria bacterium P01_H01_bin.35]
MNKKRLSWFEPGKSFQNISEWLEKAENKIRIATGFFTIKGWNLIRRYTTDKQTYLLVGLDDPGAERARIALIQEIMRDLRTGLDKDRRKAVFDLVKKIQSQEFEIVDARAADHHNKLYIYDEKAAIQTSSNLTGKGLLEQVEGGNIITDEIEITALVREFDDYFNKAQDLTQELLDILLKWLEFDTPWDIYLKTMLVSAFENKQPPKTCYTKKPVSYQIDMIAQTLRQMRDFNGSMIMASTGLGKTVVAVHVAIHLKAEDLIDNVMIIAPKAVESNWRKEMREAALPYQFFVQKIFDKNIKYARHKLKEFTDILEVVEQQRWLLIIDESHEFRNRFKKDLSNRRKNPSERTAFTRLRELIKKGNTKVLLMTGSPYGTDINNINHQLYLLPHKANNPHKVEYFLSVLPDQKYLFPQENQDVKIWSVESTDEFIKLPVVSQLTTSHVAQYYGQEDEQGTYINFSDEKRYIPNMVLHTINFQLIFEAELTAAITQGYFEVAGNPMSKYLFNQLVKISWASSPLALQDILESIADTPKGENSYELKKLYFIFPQEQRAKFLKPIIADLKNFNYSNDHKIMALSKILEKVLKNEQKVIIFSERRPTVVYLFQTLKLKFPDLKIAATIETSETEEKFKKKFKMKDSREIEEMINQFAPYANKKTNQYSETYDIFISTDTHGIGVNMQDASVVINYDIDWTPIKPVQRAGRILRFWHSPRSVEIYTFVPKLINQHQVSRINYDFVDMKNRWENLMSRHYESEKLMDSPVLTTKKIQKINFSEMASQPTNKSGEIDLNALANLEVPKGEISPYYQHTAKLQLNRDYAETLADDLISSKSSSDKEPLLYMLLFDQNKYHGIFYNPNTKKLTEPEIVAVLNKIACEKSTPTANVNYDEIEAISNGCIELWCENNKVSPDNVERICTLYLKPESEEDNFKELLLKNQSS